MKWSEAVKIWNHHKHVADTNHAWIIPHAGTPQHAEIKKIQAEEKTPEHEEILAKPSKSTLARQRIAEQRKKERAEKKAMAKAEKEQRKAEKKPRVARAKKADGIEKARQELLQEEESLEHRVKEVMGEKEVVEEEAPKKKDEKTYGLKGPMIAKQRKHLKSLLAEGARLLSDSNGILFDAAKWKSANKGVKERVLDILSVIGKMPELTTDKVILDLWEKEKAFDKPKKGQAKVIQTVKAALKRRDVTMEKAKEYLRLYAPIENEEVDVEKKEVVSSAAAPIEIPKKEFVKEHKKLIKVMKPVAEELKDQSKELKKVLAKKVEKVDYPPPVTPEESKIESKDRKKIRQFYSYYDKTFFMNASEEEREEYFRTLYGMVRTAGKNKDLVIIPDFAKKGYNAWLRKEAKHIDKLDAAEEKKKKIVVQDAKNE